MRKTFKYRLYPTRGQRGRLDSILEQCRRVYNQTLAVRKAAWEERGETLSLYDTNKLLVGWKKEQPELKAAYSQCLQEAQARVDRAFKAFFRRVGAKETPGYPRFKGRGRYASFTFKQNEFGFRLPDSEGGRLHLAGVGAVQIRLHRSIEGEVKTLTVRRDALGNWYAAFSCEVEPEPLPPTGEVVGIDLGLTHFATLSDGEQVPNPRFFRRDETALAKAQRRLSSAEEGTREWARRRQAVAHIHKRIANRRDNFAHQLSRRLVDGYDLICLEDLDIQDMQQDNPRGVAETGAAHGVQSGRGWSPCRAGGPTRHHADMFGVWRIGPKGIVRPCPSVSSLCVRTRPRP
jgi:putative transposase